MMINDTYVKWSVKLKLKFFGDFAKLDSEANNYCRNTALRQGKITAQHLKCLYLVLVHTKLSGRNWLQQESVKVTITIIE
jgi:hypothetical protein